MRKVVISGIGMTNFGSFPSVPNYVLATQAIIAALKDAGIAWKEIQSAYCGSVYQGTGAGHQALREIGLSGIPIVNVENACSSGSSAFRLGYQAIASGIYDRVIALGFEKMPKGAIASTAFRPWQLKLGFNVQPANYALEAMEYLHKYGHTIDDISMITLKNRKHGTQNPFARFRKEVSLQEINESRMIATPFHLLHCAPIADGAVCIVLSANNRMEKPSRSITIRASTLCSGIYGDPFYQNGMLRSIKHPPEEGFVEQSAREAYEASGMGPEDIDVIQMYDSMAAGELWDLEKLGFCGPGEAPGRIRDGYFSIGGKKPSNTDGGIISRGHPLGATGSAQIFELVTQLRGEAGSRQVEGAKVALSHAMGAGPNSSVTILSR